MLASSFARWFSRPERCSAPGQRPRVVVSPFPSRCAPCPSESTPAVQVAVSHASDDMVIRVKGEARPDCAGALLGGLLVPAARRPLAVTLDLSELRSISSLAMGVLVAYRRGVVRTGGRVRLGEKLQPAVCEALARAGLFELFETAAQAAAPNR